MSGAGMRESHDFLAEANAAMVEFLKADIDLAMTFINMAVSSTVTERKASCRRHARKAYDTVLRLVNRVELSKAEAVEMQEQLAKVKCSLERIGGSF